MKKHVVLISLSVIVLAILITGSVVYNNTLNTYDDVLGKYNKVTTLEDGINEKLDAYYAFRDSIPTITEDWTQEQLTKNGKFNFAIAQLSNIWRGKIETYNQTVSKVPKYVIQIGNFHYDINLPLKINMIQDSEKTEQEKVNKLLADN